MDVRDPELQELLLEVNPQAEKALSELKVEAEVESTKLHLYNAGLKSGTKRFGLFARDLLISAFILGDLDFLKETLKFALLTQGQRKVSTTGEEPGRVIHEYEEVSLRGLKTQYNASDTTQLMLIGLGKYYRTTKDKEFINNWEGSINLAVNYLLSHIKEDLFWEDPSFCNADRYALRSTYWKDDKLPGREYPDYPVAYTLVQALTVLAFREASKLDKELNLEADRARLNNVADKISNSIFTTLWDNTLDFPLIAKDKRGGISGISSDGLHILAYLQPDDVPEAKLEKILRGALSLETPYGYRTYAPRQFEYSPHNYHLGSIWPFEQFFIGQAGLIHHREELFSKSTRALEALNKYSFSELFGWDGKKLEPLGCDLQLWTVCYPLGIQKLLENL